MNRFVRHWIMAGCSAMVMVATLPSHASDQQHYEVHGVRFTTPAGFSDVQRFSGQTAGVFYPKNSVQGPRVAVRMVELSPSPMMSYMSPGEWSNYVRYSYFAMSGQTQGRQTRRFFGQSVQGDILVRNTADGQIYTEFFIIPLSEQRQLAIAFETDTQLPVQWMEEAVASVSDSLQEIPKSERKKRR